MIDTHAHIVNEYYEVDKLIDFLKDKNILYVLNAATCYEDSLEVLELSKKYKMLLPVIGLHPQNIDNENIEKIEKLILTNKVYAIGEIGLDYHYQEDNKELQKEIFKRQIDLAINNNLPVVVHTRDSIQDTLDILKDYKVKGVIHCFSGSYEIAKEFIKYGYKLGIGGVLTFKNSKLHEVIERIDIKDILLETDSPYLTPEPFRGKQNNPSNIYYVAQKIAEIKKITIDEVIEKTTKNAIELFDI